jgi:hypothetical protein
VNDACLLVQLASYRFDSVASYGCEDGVDVAERGLSRLEGRECDLRASRLVLSRTWHKMTASQGLRGQDCQVHTLRRRERQLL